jgi:hypothetical protein
MLGRLRRTTRTDVGLALAFAGTAYLVWALVAGTSRWMVQEMIKSTTAMALPRFTSVIKVFFVDTGFVIDLLGLAWLVVSLLLVVFSSRQRLSISWAWVSAICQGLLAALGAVLVAWGAYMPHVVSPDAVSTGRTPLEHVSGLSLPVVMAVALLIWVTFLVWLLIERARFDRRGPTLRDGLRTHVYK